MKFDNTAENIKTLKEIAKIVKVSYMENKGTLIKTKYSQLAGNKRAITADEIERIKWNINNVVITRLMNLVSKLKE